MRISTSLFLALLAAPATSRADDPAAAMTKDAVPGAKLLEFVPKKLGGVERSNLLDGPYVVSAAYKLASGDYDYANLDIQNTFHRGTHDTTLEDTYQTSKKLCPKKEKLAGFSACVRVDSGRAVIHWYLPDRLKVDLSAPTEKLVRAMAADLPIAAIAKLSAAR